MLQTLGIKEVSNGKKITVNAPAGANPIKHFTAVIYGFS